MDMNRTALVIGATGLVGKNLVTRLLESEGYEEIRVICRRECPVKHKKVKNYLIDFNELEKREEMFSVDDVYCSLGTTMKKAGSKEAFRAIDKDLVIKIAEIAERQKVKQFIYVSSMGADPGSHNFYLKVKGETEEALNKMDFESVHLVRPSLLLGYREEPRPAEKAVGIALSILKLIPGKFFRERSPISASMVAYAMTRIALKNRKGRFIYSSGEIKNITLGKYEW
jgi:uncharacterized protein YbjT (DUF2867 family)